VFVCLKLQNQLRGCIGSIQASQDTLAHEIVHNAIAAASRDHRFSPVARIEVNELEISVDVLGPFEPIGQSAAVDWLGVLDPQAFGVLVRAGDRHGILLPDIEGIVGATEQVAIAREKAGIGPDEPVELFRFRVTRYR
jgi:AmmeMemoRadiSam system protein A